MATLYNEDFLTFAGAGFSPTPGTGALDSDFWRVTGLSDGSGTFGGTFLSGDFARGSSTGGVTTGGVYAFDLSGDVALGFQPTGSDVTPGEVTLQYTNDTGSTLADIDVSYDLHVNNDATRGNSFNFAWSTDDISYTSVVALDYTSADAADAFGFQFVGTQSTTLSGVNLAHGAALYLQWQMSDVSGSGSRDESAIDNVLLESGPAALFEEDFSTFTGSGFVTSPSSGELDSDLWRVTGLGDGDGSFGGTHTTGDFARGTDSEGSVSTGGVYSFDISGETVLGFQPGGSDLTPGALTLQYTNTTGGTLADITVSYDLYANNDQSRANSFNFAWSTDDSSYTSVAALDYTSAEASDALGFQSIGTRTTTLTGVNLANGADLYLQWQLDDVSGSGSRDEFGIDNILLEGGGGTPDTTAPVLVTLSPADDSSGAFIGSNLTMTFDEAVQAGTGNITLHLTSDDSVVETFDVTSDVTFSGTDLIINPASDLMETTDYYLQVASGAVEDLAGNAYAGFADTTTWNFTSGTTLKIGDVQGTSDTAALNGATVTLTGIVTGDFQTSTGEDGDIEGFFLQDSGDGDAATSDGIFIYDGGVATTDVSKGDEVTISGVVSERFGKTVVDVSAGSVSIDTVNAVADITTLVTTIDMDTIGARGASGNYIAELEAYESMLVDTSQDLTIISHRNLDNYVEFTVSSQGRIDQYSQNATTISTAGYDAYEASVQSNSFIIDNGFDGTSSPIIFPDGSFDTADSFRLGNTTSDAFGIMDYGFSNFRMRIVDADDDGQVYDELTFDTSANPRPTGTSVSGSVVVANANIENLFTTLGSRGAGTTTELANQLDKIAEAFIDIDADVFSLIEIENDFNFDGSTALEALVGELNGRLGAGTYDYVDPGVTAMGTDAIATGFIYKTATMEVTSGTTVEFLQDSDLSGLGITDFGDLGAIFDGVNSNRNPLAVSFTEIASGESFTAVANHFKSKGGTGSGANADLNNGVADWNEVRTLGAQAVDTWLATDPTGSGDSDFLILGDLNAYAAEDPVTWLEGAGYADLNDYFGDDYTYVFSGQTGTLDYGIANQSLGGQVVGFEHWHGNTDEQETLNYEFASTYPSHFDGSTPWRYADHDPVVIGLDLGRNTLTNGNDNHVASVFDDEIFALNGNDIIEGGAGADTIDGGSGRDRVQYISSSAGVTVDLSDGSPETGGDAEGDILISIENVYGSHHDDVITGDNGNNVIRGLRGNDTISTLGGNDQIVSSRDADTIDGGAGVDAVRFSPSTAGVTVSLLTGTGLGGDAEGDSYTDIERLYGSDFDDILTGEAGNNLLVGEGGDDELYGDAGNDTLDGRAGADLLDGGLGNDTIFYRSESAGVIIDLDSGLGGGAAAGDSYVSIERARGSAFDDVFIGDVADNQFFGDGGADSFAGGAGRDVFYGGADGDSFAFAAGDVFARVKDFADNVDSLDLTDYAFGGFAAASAWMSEVSGDLWFTRAGERIIVENMTIADIQDDVLL